MRIFTKIVLDWSGNILESVSYEYSGPLALCGDAGLGVDGAATAVADPGGDAGGEVSTEIAPEPGAEGAEETPFVPMGEEIAPEPGAEEVVEPEPGAEPEVAKPTTEPLPKELAKAIRELRTAHPEQAQALKTLNDAYFARRAFQQVFPGGPDEARILKADIEQIGGREGIAAMRSEVQSIQTFDRMASEGDARVIEGLAEEFPDGFKKLVAPAIERLSKIDAGAFRETMRGPLLQMLEGDGLIDTIGAAMESLKAAANEPDHASLHYRDANTQLNRIAVWYNKLREDEKGFRERYQDPQLQELKQGQARLREEQAKVVWGNYNREISGYVGSTVQVGLRPMLANMKLGEQGVSDLTSGIRQEMYNTLKADKFYMDSVAALIAQNKTAEAVSFAKPYIDKARRNAVNTVWTRRYGTMPAAKRTPAAPAAQPGTAGKPPVKPSATPVVVAKKPAGDEIDWSRDRDHRLFLTNRAYLRQSGRFVTWAKQARA